MNRLWTKNYTIITIGSVVSMLGNSMAGFAMSLFVLDYTQSPLYYAIYMFLYTLPQIAAPVLAGPLMDRFSRRRTIYMLDFASTAIYALLAGLMTARGRCDMSISMDADLQDDMDAMDRFIEKYREGCDVVYGVRNRRDTDTAFKRGTALMFYRLMKALGVDIVFNHADYRLMSKRAVEGLAEFTEVNLFLRGIVPQIGYKWTTVTYERAERFAGESKYPLKKMIAFAADGITSFSVKPIRLVFSTGVVVFIISLLMLLYALIAKIAGHTSVGWTSLMGSIWLIGGIQLLGLGVVGEYIGKIYNETKRRPRFIIESVLNKADITVYLRMPADVALSRRLSASKPDRLEQQKADFFSRTYQAYERLFAGQEKRVLTVNAAQSIEQVTQTMLDGLDERLDGLEV